MYYCRHFIAHSFKAVFSELKLFYAISCKVVHHVAMALSCQSASVTHVTSCHVVCYGELSQLRSLRASPLQYHVTRQGFNGCFAGARSLSLVTDGAPAGRSVRGFQRKRTNESNSPVRQKRKLPRNTV